MHSLSASSAAGFALTTGFFHRYRQKIVGAENVYSTYMAHFARSFFEYDRHVRGYHRPYLRQKRRYHENHHRQSERHPAGRRASYWQVGADSLFTAPGWSRMVLAR